MMRPRSTKEQGVGILDARNAGVDPAIPPRRHSIGRTAYPTWHSKHAGVPSFCRDREPSASVSRRSAGSSLAIVGASASFSTQIEYGEVPS